MATLTTLNCPKCSAPLHPARSNTVTLCVYCGSAVRVAADLSQSQPAVEITLPEAVAGQLRQLLLDGHHVEAITLYRQHTGSNVADAEAAVQSLREQVSLKILRNQTLSPFGVVLVLLSAVLAVASAAAGLLGRLHPLVALVLTALAGLQLVYFGPAILKTVRFLGARMAPARVVRMVPIGQIKPRRQAVVAARLLLEVLPDGAEPFPAELLVPVREQSLHKAQPGSMLRVKYLPADRSQVIYSGSDA